MVAWNCGRRVGPPTAACGTPTAVLSWPGEEEPSGACRTRAAAGWHRGEAGDELRRWRSAAGRWIWSTHHGQALHHLRLQATITTSGRQTWAHKCAPTYCQKYG
jgi:hypothetical protein